jgi:hypothetical protein
MRALAQVTNERWACYQQLQVAEGQSRKEKYDLLSGYGPSHFGKVLLGETCAKKVDLVDPVDVGLGKAVHCICASQEALGPV